MAGLEDLTVGKARAEAVGIVKAVEIDLGLGMMMRGIGGPLAGMVQDLAQDHVGEGGVVQIEKGLDLSLHAAHQFTIGALVFGLHGLGGVHDGLIGLVVQGLLDVQLAVGVGGQGDLGALAGQQAVGLVVEAVGAVSIDLLAIPLVGDLAREQQDRDLLVGLVEGKDVAVLHQQQAHIHLGAHIVHSGVDIGIVAVLQFGVLIKIGHRKHLLF